MNIVWTSIVILACFIPFYVGIGMHLIELAQLNIPSFTNPEIALNSDISLPTTMQAPIVTEKRDVPLPTTMQAPTVTRKPDVPLPTTMQAPIVTEKRDVPLSTTMQAPTVTKKPDVPLPTTIPTSNVTMEADIPKSTANETSDITRFENFDDAIFSFQTKLIEEINLDGSYAISPHAATITLLLMTLGAGDDTKRELSTALNLRPSDFTLPLNMKSPTAVGIKSLINTFIPNNIPESYHPIRINPACKISDKFNKTINDLELDVNQGGEWGAWDPTIKFPSEVTFAAPVTQFSMNCWRNFGLGTRFAGRFRRGNLPNLDGAKFYELPYTGSDRGLNNVSLIFIRQFEKNLLDIKSIKRKFSKLNYADFSNYREEMFEFVIENAPFYQNFNFTTIFPSGIISNATINPEGYFNDDFQDFCNVNQHKMSHSVGYNQQLQFSMKISDNKDCREGDTDGVNAVTVWLRYYIVLLIANKSILTFIMYV